MRRFAIVLALLLTTPAFGQNPAKTWILHKRVDEMTDEVTYKTARLVDNTIFAISCNNGIFDMVVHTNAWMDDDT